MNEGGLFKLIATDSSPIGWAGQGGVGDSLWSESAGPGQRQAAASSSGPPPHPHQLLPWSLSPQNRAQSQPSLPQATHAGVRMVLKGLMRCTGPTLTPLAGGFLEDLGGSSGGGEGGVQGVQM